MAERRETETELRMLLGAKVVVADCNRTEGVVKEGLQGDLEVDVDTLLNTCELDEGDKDLLDLVSLGARDTEQEVGLDEQLLVADNTEANDSIFANEFVEEEVLETVEWDNLVEMLSDIESSGSRKRRRDEVTDDIDTPEERLMRFMSTIGPADALETASEDFQCDDDFSFV